MACISMLTRNGKLLAVSSPIIARLVFIAALLSLMGYMAYSRAPVRGLGGFDVAANGFWKGREAVQHHFFDQKLADALVVFFKKENATSIIELGCGTGSYAKTLKAAGFYVDCSDGNPSTPEITNGTCGVLDLSQPIPLPFLFSKYDWTLSLEVGEHIPNKFETTVLNNLAKTNRLGMVLSWAVEGQPGMSHVNNRNNAYIRHQFEERGYESDFEAEKTLRKFAKYHWFKNTIMVFRKQRN